MMRASRRYDEPQTAVKSLSQRNLIIQTEQDSVMSGFESPHNLDNKLPVENYRRERFSHKVSEHQHALAEFKVVDNDGTHSQDASFRQYNSQIKGSYD